jgi:hypothetical protein
MRIPLRENAFVRLIVPLLQPGCSIPLSFFERTGVLYLRCHVDEKVPNTYPVFGPCTNSVFPSPLTGGTEHRIRDACLQSRQPRGRTQIRSYEPRPKFTANSQAERCESKYDTRLSIYLAPRRGIRTVGQGCTGIFSHRRCRRTQT